MNTQVKQMNTAAANSKNGKVADKNNKTLLKGVIRDQRHTYWTLRTMALLLSP